MAWATRRILLALLAWAAVAGLAVSQDAANPQEFDTAATDLKMLRDVGLPGDGAALLEYFRKLTLPTADPKRIETLIRQLGDSDFETREEAYTSLAALGAAATQGLKQYEHDKDTELRKRVADLKRRIETKAEPAVQAAAARMIARSKPADAAEVLLAFLPFAVDSSVVDEICKTLGAVAVVDGKVEPAVIKALSDKSSAIKRGAAAEALVRAKADAEMPAVRALLKDADPLVRLRTSMALVRRRDKEVVPVLIELLGELNSDQLWPAEEVLIRLAGEKAPPVSLGTDPATRKATRDAWQKWYVSSKDKIDLARLESPDVALGYTLLVFQTINRAAVAGKAFRGIAYEVMEIKADKSVRWKFDANTQIVDAQVVGDNRVLCAEFQNRRVTERDFKGAVLFEKQLNGNPISVQRLPNGNTFVVMQTGLYEFNRKGDEVYSYSHNNVMRGKKLRNGEICFVANQGQGVFTRMDSKNKVLKTFNVNAINSLFGGMDVLPNGGVLLPDWQQQRVVEYDRDGRQVNQINGLTWPLGVQRLPNGNTLISTQNAGGINTGRVVEYDRKGNQVMSFQPEGAATVFNAHRR